MSNFFTLYSDYVSKTEPPPNFHAWSAIGAISALLGKKCQIPQGHFTVFPNLYVVLVGDAGTRKSTAMNISKRLVRLVDTVPIAADSGSREGLLDDMAGNKVIAEYAGRDISYWQSSAFVTEMQEFLGGKHINSAMVGFLTAIWDEPIFKEKTRKGGMVVINNPYFTMLGCCTPSWMNDKLKQDVITDGFARRTIFALESELNCLNPWPESSPEQLEIFAQMGQHAKRIHQIKGQFELTKAARELYDARYMRTREEAAKYSEKVQSYFTSKHILALKIAMCLSAGVSSSRVITSDIMQASFTFLKQSERALETVFGGIGRNELKALYERGLQRIRLAGEKGMTKAEFIKAGYDDANAMELNELWNTLQEVGDVVQTAITSVQDVPRVRAKVLNPIAPGEDLMKLVRLLTERQEPRMGVSGAFSVASHLDPETVRLLALEKEWKIRTSSGVLRKGTPTQSAGEIQTPSKKPAG